MGYFFSALVQAKPRSLCRPATWPGTAWLWYCPGAACYCNGIQHQRELGRRSMNPAALPAWCVCCKRYTFVPARGILKLKNGRWFFTSCSFTCPESAENCSSVQDWNCSFSSIIYIFTHRLLIPKLIHVSWCPAIKVLASSALEKATWRRHTASLKVTTAMEQSSISLLLKKQDALGTLIPEVLTPNLGFTLHRPLDFWEFLDSLMERKAYLFHWDVVRIL